MNKLSTTNVLLLMCLVLLPLCMADTPYKPVRKFDHDKVTGIIWYQLLWADTTAEYPPSFCCFNWYQRMCPTDSTNFWQLNSYHFYDTNSRVTIGGINGKVNPEAQGELRISYTGDQFDSEYIIDYADDYSWLIRGDNYSDEVGFIDLVAKTPTGHDAAVARAKELAKKYNLTYVHSSTHSSDCDYIATLAKMRKISAL